MKANAAWLEEKAPFEAKAPKGLSTLRPRQWSATGVDFDRTADLADTGSFETYCAFDRTREEPKLTKMDDLWLEYAKRLQALASTGAAFTRDQFDRERYDEIAQIAEEMMARLGSVPVSRTKELIGPYATGYATPKVDVRGIVFDGEKLLLVKEKSDAKWALPGGYADVGLSPAENVSKEILEEAGLVVEVTALLGVRHKKKGRSEPDTRDFYKLFFACDGIGKATGPNDPSIAKHAYFRRDAIPELSTGRTTQTDIDMAFDYLGGARRAASFH